MLRDDVQPAVDVRLRSSAFRPWHFSCRSLSSASFASSPYLKVFFPTSSYLLIWFSSFPLLDEVKRSKGHLISLSSLQQSTIERLIHSICNDCPLWFRKYFDKHRMSFSVSCSLFFHFIFHFIWFSAVCWSTWFPWFPWVFYVSLLHGRAH